MIAYVTRWRRFLTYDSLPETPPMHYNPDERHDDGSLDEAIAADVDVKEMADYYAEQRALQMYVEEGQPMGVLIDQAHRVTAAREARARRTC